MKNNKFRSWCEFLGVFAYFENGKYWYDHDGKHFDTGVNAFDWNNAEQYTGLKDCKRTEEYPEGQEIYDGDIILLNTYSTANGIKGLYSIAKHTISHESKIYGQGNGGSAEFSGFYFNGYYGIPSEGEVVGNIHENKDLLNE